MVRFVPALLLVFTAAWCGTQDGGATFAGSATAAASLLAVLVWKGCSWRDPLRLGRAGRWLLPALWVAAALSAWASPVPRAGLGGLILLPAFFGLPDAIARCWPGEAQRRQGIRAVSGLVGAIALWALLGVILGDTPRAALPLGHHNLLAAWLVITLPLAVLPARERGPWRLLGIGSGLLGIAAVLASRSLLGGAALAVEVVGAAFILRRRSWGRALLGVVALSLVLVLVLQGPRLLRIAAGEDSSSQARAVYAEAGWRGFLARPLVGWGPGSAGWTAALFLAPRPGVNPWGEAVGELHSLPLQLAYELGLAGLLPALGAVGLFLRRRFRERREAADPALLAAGLLGLAGAAIAALGTAALHVLALPVAAAVAAGACLAARSGDAAGESAVPVRVYALAAVLALAPLLAAQRSYDRAVAADLSGDRDQARQALAQAVRLDPAFPLYRMRLALLRGTEAAELARRAAEDGHAVAAAWTVAGILGEAEGRPWAPAALQTACSLDPLAPFPPFYRMLADPAAPEAARHGAHALLAEPRLAAAVFWKRHPDLFTRALEEVRTWPGVDPGWKEALLASAPAPGMPGDEGERARLALEIDAERSTSLSLFLFHRRPWPAQWPLVAVARGALERLDLPAATALATTAPSAFTAFVCRPRSVPERPLPTR